MLDGLIQVLETVVAMEGLSDVAGDDLELQLPEIVVSDPNSSTGYSFTDKFKEWRENILS